MILAGRKPTLSIEITRECPLRCPGCYAYDDQHLGGGVLLRQLQDFKGSKLVDNILEIVDRLRPIHLSLVGGDPLVRFRELEILIPKLVDKGVHVQLVTSLFRPPAAAWAGLPRLNTVVSIDGLAEEHDPRRTPATYERILKNVVGHQVTIHCTVTGQMMRKDDLYLERFVRFWSDRPEVKRIWFSLFTPQRGAELEEILTPAERTRVIDEMLRLRRSFPKFEMPREMIEEFRRPPQSPEDCIFAQTTATLSADLTTSITPCQFGGDPDCSQCGCAASMGLAAVGRFQLGGFIPVGKIFTASQSIGAALARLRSSKPAVPALAE